jgi:hypothetical protein
MHGPLSILVRVAQRLEEFVKALATCSEDQDI